MQSDHQLLGAVAPVMAATATGSYPETEPTPAPGLAEFAFHADGPAEQPSEGRRPASWLAGTVALVVVAALGLLGFAFLRGPSAEQAAIAAANASATDLLGQLAGAEYTADLRALAAEAERAEAELASATETAPADSGSLPSMAAYGDLLAALSGMSGIDGDNLAQWQDTSRSILAAVDSVKEADPEGEETAQLATLAATSVASAATMVSEAEAVMAQWRQAEAEAIERNLERQAIRDELDAYAPRVEAILSEYAAERTRTARFTDRIRTDYVTVQEAYDEFRAGETARLDLANELRALSYPDGLASEHARLVGMLEAGADGMAAGYRGLEEYVYDWGYTPYDETPGWVRFQDESDRISAEFGPAERSWQDSISTAYDAAQDEAVPMQPEV